VEENQANIVIDAKSSLTSSVYTLIIVGIATVILGSILILLISRRITTDLNEVVTITSDVADGDLTVDSMGYEGTDEIGQLASAANLMKDNIRNILTKVMHAARNVTSSSDELTLSANEVKEGSEQVAATMEE